jgi:hypothetical protein
MAMRQVLEVYELLDSAKVTGRAAAELLRNRGIESVEVTTIKGKKGSTDFIKATILGLNGKSEGGKSSTLGIIGRLGGVGARPERVGLVSDADGAVTALSCALKLADMKRSGDDLKGDVVVATHICPNSPVEPHEPVPFMGSPVDMKIMNEHEVDPKMDAVLSIDTTKGNRIIKFKGVSITPTVKEGYILKVSNDLVNILEWVTGTLPRIVPITTQDITPYGNGLDHMNSIMQPCVATTVPVVGVAITSDVPVPGCATGASHVVDIECAARFCIEVAKAFGERKCRFYDEREFGLITELYGSMRHLGTLGKAAE